VPLATRSRTFGAFGRWVTGGRQTIGRLPAGWRDPGSPDTTARGEGPGHRFTSITLPTVGTNKRMEVNECQDLFATIDRWTHSRCEGVVEAGRLPSGHRPGCRYIVDTGCDPTVPGLACPVHAHHGRAASHVTSASWVPAGLNSMRPPIFSCGSKVPNGPRAPVCPIRNTPQNEEAASSRRCR